MPRRSRQDSRQFRRQRQVQISAIAGKAERTFAANRELTAQRIREDLALPALQRRVAALSPDGALTVALE
jgi:hypothetical protein